ncbi:ATP synthase subunit I [Paenibacillus chartarius]|uniref:ATP synthase subunit I n=1 Tax=Paenibacillus chartarius TaxID=747481 RepID=A0ABV6DUS1_9BACL
MNVHMKPIVRAVLLAMSVSLVIWAVFPAYRSYATGFILGMMVSLINAWLLMIKIEAISKMVAEGTKKRVNLGFVSRVCMAILAVMVAVKLPQVDLVFTIIGLFSVQLGTLVMGLVTKKGNHP